MKLEINITKRYVWMLSAVIVLVGAALFVMAQTAPNAGGVWHALQTISTDSTGTKSVDADGDGLIDTTEGWKLLARGSDWTEEAIILIRSSGVTFETDTSFDGQRVNVGNFEWFTYQPKEITFIVKNPGDEYCVGGGSALAIASGGGGAASKCTDYFYKGTTLTKINRATSNWIRLRINDQYKGTCPDVFGRTPSADYPGVYGIQNYFGVMCLYKKDADWTGDITNIVIEEADWSPDYSMWEWEVWYK